MSDEVLSVERIIEIIEENKRREDRFISEDLMDYPKALENFMKTYFVPDETRALFYKLAKEDKLFREVYTFFHDIYGENWMFKYYKNLLPRNSIRFTDYFQILTNFIRMAYNLLGFKDSDFSMLKPEQVEFCELEACTEYFYFNDKHWIILDRESPFKIEEGIYHEGIHVLFNLLIKKNESNTYSDIFITNPSKFSSSQIFYLKVLNESFTLFMQQHLFGEESLLPLKERYSLNKLGDDLDSDSSILSKVSKSNAIIKKLVEDSKMQIKLARERFSYLASKEITEESDLLECMEFRTPLSPEHGNVPENSRDMIIKLGYKVDKRLVWDRRIHKKYSLLPGNTDGRRLYFL